MGALVRKGQSNASSTTVQVQKGFSRPQLSSVRNGFVQDLQRGPARVNQDLLSLSSAASDVRLV